MTYSLRATPGNPIPEPPLFPIGTRVVCRYGRGVVEFAWPPPPDRPELLRTWLLGVAADVGGLWLEDELDLVPERPLTWEQLTAAARIANRIRFLILAGRP